MRRLDYIAHHGILGMKWGVRRYQNKDGTRTALGKSRYDSGNKKFYTKIANNKSVVVANKVEKRIIDRYNNSNIIMSKNDHYYRNRLNNNLPKTQDEAISDHWHTVVANAHQFTKDSGLNVKYVDPDGKEEVVFDKNGNIITNALDIGSYNYVPSEVSYYGHFKYDILPWIMYGNSEDDPSSVGQRIEGIFGHYNKNAVKLGERYSNSISNAFDMYMYDLEEQYDSGGE